ncbi:hypothetical protein SCHPADRAFT_901488 [Schizopora paradoxa]|uniref:Uncharacterized protein n=1 Tax=Schizopora paradoxa TaxID=27342 RepID=A0A0H2RXQ6_9AGAM|nr:hypothetical protein SCHPADRAFT_901488 [Schizopora paradoxa]
MNSRGQTCALLSSESSQNASSLYACVTNSEHQSGLERDGDLWRNGFKLEVKNKQTIRGSIFDLHRRSAQPRIDQKPPVMHELPDPSTHLHFTNATHTLVTLSVKVKNKVTEKNYKISR